MAAAHWTAGATGSTRYTDDGGYKPADGYRERRGDRAGQIREQLAYWREHVAKQAGRRQGVVAR